MESQPQNPEFRINPENFHPCYQQTTKVATSKERVKVPPKAGSRQHFQILKCVTLSNQTMLDISWESQLKPFLVKLYWRQKWRKIWEHLSSAVVITDLWQLNNLNPLSCLVFCLQRFLLRVIRISFDMINISILLSLTIGMLGNCLWFFVAYRFFQNKLLKNLSEIPSEC